MKNKILDISIVSANYNNAPFIKEYFNSIINSYYFVKEIIFIDDSSNDNSLEYTLLFKNQLRNLKIISLKENIGFANSLNIGINYAKGKYIMRLDPDDFISPERIGKQYFFLEKNPEIDIVGSNVFYFNDSLKRVVFTSNFPEHSKNINKLFYSGHHGIAHNSIMGKTDIFKNFKYIQSAYPAEDYNIFSRMIKNNVIMYNIQLPLTYYRIHNKNISNTNSKKIFKKVFYYQTNIFGNKKSFIRQQFRILHFIFFRKALLVNSDSKRNLLFFLSLLFYPSKIFYFLFPFPKQK